MRFARAAATMAGIALLADQASKWVIIEHVMASPRLIPVTPFFNLTLGFNRGVSFGMLGNGAVGPLLLTGLTVAIVALLMVWAWRSQSRWEARALGAIVGGALGNAVDRLRQGAVTDFLDFHLMGWHWPAFNLADVAIVCGAGALMLQSLRSTHREKAAADAVD